MRCAVATCCLVLALMLLLGGCPKDDVVEPPADPTPPGPAPAAGAEPERALRFAFVTVEGEFTLVDPETMATSVAPGELTDVGDHVSYSADGTVLAYLGHDEQVYVADLADGTREVIGPAADPYMRTFALSPDGTKVALLRDGGVGVWQDGALIEISGPERCTAPTWSPDSSTLAIGAMGEDESVDGGLWLWTGGEAAERIVPPVTDDWGSTQDVMWSPDGRWLAWARGAGDGWIGDLAHADGSELRRDEIGAGPIAWLPDGSGLLASIHIEAGAFTSGIYRMADRTLTRIGPEYWGSQAALSADGSRVLAWGYDGSGLMVDVASGEETPWGEGLTILQAVWAPDGRLALLLGDEERRRTSLWIGEADGAELGSIEVSVEHGWWSGRWIELPADAATPAQ